MAAVACDILGEYREGGGQTDIIRVSRNKQECMLVLCLQPADSQMEDIVGR